MPPANSKRARKRAMGCRTYHKPASALLGPGCPRRHRRTYGSGFLAGVPPGGDLDALAKAGYVVLAVQTRGTPEVRGSDGTRRRLCVPSSGCRQDASGHASRRPHSCGRLLASRPDVDRGKIAASGRAGKAYPCYMQPSWTPASAGRFPGDTGKYWMGIEGELHRNLDEMAIPGCFARMTRTILLTH